MNSRITLFVLICLVASTQAFGMMRMAMRPMLARNFAPRALAAQHTLHRFAPPVYVPQVNPFHKPYAYTQQPHFKPQPPIASRWWLGAGAGLIAAATVQQAHSEAETPTPPKPAHKKSWAALEKEYRRRFENSEQQFWKEFFKLTGYDSATWQQHLHEVMIPTMHRECDEAVEQCKNYTLSPNFKEKIVSMLEEQGVNSSLISIGNNDNLSSPMLTIGNAHMGKAALIINEKMLRLMLHSDIELEAIIAHEIQHLKHNVIIPSSIPARTPQLEKKLQQKIMQYKYMIETQCDCLAGLTMGPKHLYAMAQLYGRLPYNASITVEPSHHPSLERRASDHRYLFNVVTYLYGG